MAKIAVSVWVAVVMAALGLGAACAQTPVKEGSFELLLPQGWSATKSLPQGIKAGFRKSLKGGKKATFLVNYDIIPPDAGEPPKDTSGMERQFTTMITSQFPGAKSFEPPPLTNGAKIINQAYELTDGGVRLKRWHALFFVKPINFAVQCSAPPDQWESALDDFKAMLASLRPRSDAAKKR